MKGRLPVFLAACLGAAAASPALAERFGDVEVAPIAGETAGTDHGYAAYRFRVRNDGAAPVRVGIQLGNDSSPQGLATVRRETEVPAGAGVELVLLQPAESFYAGSGKVTLDGRRQEAEIPVTPLNHGQPGYVSGVGANPRFMLTSNRLATEERDALVPDPAKTGGGPGFQNATAALPVAEWSADWLAYTRWDAVALTRDEFDAAPPAVRAALEKWVRAGGQLLVLRADAKSVPAEWTAESPGGDDEAGAPVRRLGLGHAFFVAKGGARSASTAAFNRANASEAPANKTPDCAKIGEGQVPVRGMFLLMLAFAVLVGPVNYLWCARKNRRVWMLWTSPAIATVFIAAVFAYALFSDGIRPWGRTVAVTLLDEKAHSAVTLGTTAWYAPMLPSDGLRFGSSTEVRSMAGHGWDDGRSGLCVVHGSSQWLTGGWMVPRYPESFGYRKVGESRLRMTFDKDAQGNTWATNGLGVEVEEIEVFARDHICHGKSVPAGGRVKLEEGAGTRMDAGIPDAFTPLRDHWQVLLARPLFAEIPFDDARSHEVSEIVVGNMEETK